MKFLQKLDYLMDKYGLNKSTLSQNSGIPYTTIDGWYKKGYEGLKLTTFRKLADYFNTTLDYWVLDEVTDPNYGKASGFEVSYLEMIYIQKYRSLPTEGQETVNNLIDNLYNMMIPAPAKDEQTFVDTERAKQIMTENKARKEHTIKIAAFGGTDHDPKEIELTPEDMEAVQKRLEELRQGKS